MPVIIIFLNSAHWISQIQCVIFIAKIIIFSDKNNFSVRKNLPNLIDRIAQFKN